MSAIDRTARGEQSTEQRAAAAASRCTCGSTKPGTSTPPAQSISCPPVSGPSTATIRPPSIVMRPACGWVGSIVIARTLVRLTVIALRVGLQIYRTGERTVPLQPGWCVRHAASMDLIVETTAVEPPPGFAGPTDDLLAFLTFGASERYGALHPLSGVANILRRKHAVDLLPLFSFGDAVPDDEEDERELERIWQDPMPL